MRSADAPASIARYIDKILAGVLKVIYWRYWHRQSGTVNAHYTKFVIWTKQQARDALSFINRRAWRYVPFCRNSTPCATSTNMPRDSSSVTRKLKLDWGKGHPYRELRKFEHDVRSQPTPLTKNVPLTSIKSLGCATTSTELLKEHFPGGANHSLRSSRGRCRPKPLE